MLSYIIQPRLFSKNPELADPVNIKTILRKKLEKFKSFVSDSGQIDSCLYKVHKASLNDDPDGDLGSGIPGIDLLFVKTKALPSE